MDAKKTLAEHRRLLVAGGWPSLLAATCLIDLRRFPAAAARLRTAVRLADETEHGRSRRGAWSRRRGKRSPPPTTGGRWTSQVAQRSSSACIQATAQEGRAWARLGAAEETRATLNRATHLVEPLRRPDRPERHHRYDPAKPEAFIATTLS